MAKFLLSDRALLEGVFKQLAGITGSQVDIQAMTEICDVRHKTPCL